MVSERRPAETFGFEYAYVQTDWELRDVVASVWRRDRAPFGRRDVWCARNAHRLTGAFVLLGEAEYREVWVTDSSRPWATWAEYVRIV